MPANTLNNYIISRAVEIDD